MALSNHRPINESFRTEVVVLFLQFLSSALFHSITNPITHIQKPALVLRLAHHGNKLNVESWMMRTTGFSRRLRPRLIHRRQHEQELW